MTVIVRGSKMDQFRATSLRNRSHFMFPENKAKISLPCKLAKNISGFIRTQANNQKIPSMPLTPSQPRTSLVVKILIVGFGVSLIVNIFIGNYQKLGYPFNTFLFQPQVSFSDFFYPYQIASDPYSKSLDTSVDEGIIWKLPEIINGHVWTKNGNGPLYFPFAYWIAYLFHLLPLGTAILAFWMVSALIFALICIKHIRRSGSLGMALLVCILSYPFMILIDRSNLEIFVFLFVYLFFLWYDQHPWLSAGALALATAMKFLPIGYVVLFIRDKKYKQALFMGGLALFITIIGYASYPGGLLHNIQAHLFNLRISSLFYGFFGRDVAFNSNLTSGVKYLTLLFWPRPDLEASSLAAEGVLNWLIPILTGFVLIYFFLFENIRWKQAALLTCLVLLIPPSSADYRLILIYIPFFLWMETPSRPHYDSLYAIFFAGLFIPKSYFHLPALPEISISVLVNPLLMIGLIGVLMVERITELAHQRVKVKDFWTVLPGWQKSCSAILAVFILIWLVSLEFHSPSKTPQSSTAQQLMSLGTVAEYYQEYMDAAGYYDQWVTLDSSDPEPRLSLARAFMGLKSYWLAYEQYKMTIWLSNPDAIIHKQAEAGLQAAMEHVICYEQGIHEFEWARLLRKEYNQQFPDLPLQEQLECEKILYDPKSWR